MRWAGNVSLRGVFAVLALIALGQMSAIRAHAQQATVAEEPITEPEIELRSKLRAATGKTYSREQVIAELRDEKRKIREARQAGAEILDAEVDAEWARMARRMGQTVAQMKENLALKGIGPETIKHRLHADIAWQRYQEGASSRSPD